MTLTFQGQIWNLLYLNQKWHNCHETKKQTYRLNCRHQMWPPGLTLVLLILTLNFQCQIWNLLYISAKNGSIATKQNKNIDWILGIKCDHRVWPWPWPWLWNFKVKYGLCYISAKTVRLPWNKKQTYRSNFRHQVWSAQWFDLGHDIDLEFSRSNIDFAISQPKWSDCHETKIKPIDWMLSINMWRSGLTVILNFQDHIYGIWYISARNYPI